MSDLLPRQVMNELADVIIDDAIYSGVDGVCIQMVIKRSTDSNFLCIFPQEPDLVPQVQVNRVLANFDTGATVDTICDPGHYAGIPYRRFTGRYEGRPVVIDILSKPKPAGVEFPPCPTLGAADERRAS